MSAMETKMIILSMITSQIHNERKQKKSVSSPSWYPSLLYNISSRHNVVISVILSIQKFILKDLYISLIRMFISLEQCKLGDIGVCVFFKTTPLWFVFGQHFVEPRLFQVLVIFRSVAHSEANNNFRSNYGNIFEVRHIRRHQSNLQ